MNEPSEQLEAAARAWIDGDPDPETRAELSRLVAARDAGALGDRMKPLTFGTAGLRGAVGAGSGRMNLAVVLRTAHAIAGHVSAAAGPRGPVVIGFDARPTSRSFAEASAAVLLAAGLEVVAFAEPAATPLCAFLGRELGAPITIVVTASHNPRPDNGYKVYGADAIQITSPVDVAIARRIEAAPRACDVPRAAVTFDAPHHPRLTLVDEGLLGRYFSALSAAEPPNAQGRELHIVHSALHGVGSKPMLRALREAGFQQVSSVVEQAEPDGTFPTTPFPNPEEAGTLDLALAEAQRQNAALLLVNDPDADRLAAAARLDGELHVLDGNQVGMLLADHALTAFARRASGTAPLVLSSVVSSPLVAALCQARGARYERTHTGFKWLWSAALSLERAGQGSFCFAYEEALGYSVFPAVRDKDGIAAGRALAELAAELGERGATLFDRLFELYAEHGLWASAALNVALSGSDAAVRLSADLEALLRKPELRLEGQRVTRVVDYRAGADGRPVWLGAASLYELELESGARIFVRPSGTEPKLKLYGHVRGALSRRSELGRELTAARSSAAALLSAIARALHQ
jgi:phosphomannomutase